MPLPAAPLASSIARVGTTDVPIRSLTRGEMLHLFVLKDEPDADAKGEVYMIARATGATDEDALAWWEESDPAIVQSLIIQIATVSRLEVPGAMSPKQRPNASSSKTG